MKNSTLDFESYSKKNQNYFNITRKEILPLINSSNLSVLEVGCGDGSTLLWLKEIGLAKKTFGIEILTELNQTLTKKTDGFWIGDIEKQKPSMKNEKFDLILFLDVLEHLHNPEQVLSYLIHNHLNLEGKIIISIPNIKHYSVLIPLIFKDRWDYGESGILDRTHLRFFTYSTIIDFIENLNLKIEKQLFYPLLESRKHQILNFLTFGILKYFLQQRYLFSLMKKNIKV